MEAQTLKTKTKEQQYNEYLAFGGGMSIQEWEADGRYDRWLSGEIPSTTKPQALFPSGHQLQLERRSVDACKSSMEEAFGHISNIQNPEVQTLAIEIAGLMAKAYAISYAMEEAYNIND